VTNNLKSSISEPDSPIRGPESTDPGPVKAPAGWVKVGAIAAASAVLGGLAAAWFYRKTLSQLREAGNEIPDSLPNITENETEEDF
jgi:hypothetical protein